MGEHNTDGTSAKKPIRRPWGSSQGESTDNAYKPYARYA
jgi:hypothetical protein